MVSCQISSFCHNSLSNARTAKNKGNIRHELVDIIVITLCAIICRYDSFVAVEYLGHEREEYFRDFLELPNGIPDADTFRRVFERLNPKALASCLNEWLGIEHEKRCVVAIDGKTICGSEEEFHSDVALYFSEFANSHPAHTTVEKGHGRVETREYRLCTDIGWLEKSDCWKGLNAIGNAVSRHTLTNRAVPIGTALFMRNIPTTIPFLPNNYYFRHHQA